MRLLSYGAILIPTICWGSNFVVVKLLLRDVSPFAVLVLRIGLGALSCLLLLAVIGRGLPKLPRRQIGRLIFVALAGTALNTVAVTFAVSFLGAGISSVVIMLTPVMTGALAVIAGQETLSARKLQGFVVALVGLGLVALLGGPGVSFDGTQIVGLLLMVAAAIAFAIYNVHTRPLFASYTPAEVTGYVGLFSSLGLVVFVVAPPLWTELAALGGLTPTGWLAAAWLGLLSNLIGFIVWYRALGRLDASRVALFSYLIPVWGLIGAALIFQERVTWWLAVGVIFMLTGIILANREGTARRSMRGHQASA